MNENRRYVSCESVRDMGDRFFTIEEHLKNFENDNDCAKIWNIWQIEKQEYSDQLSTIITSYPEYSLHDESHSKKILATIERLLGPDRIKLLSQGDSWLLLQCAYTHDLGMYVTDDDVQSFLSSPDIFDKEIQKESNQRIFNRIIEKFSKRNAQYPYSSSFDIVQRASEYWKENSRNLYSAQLFRDAVLSDAFSLARYYLDTIISEYFREKHSERSREILKNRRIENELNDKIPSQMRRAVEQIAYLHCGHPKHIMDLKHSQNGFDSRDYIHPRFVAALLRIGDLMDMESTRFNPFVIGKLARMSQENTSYLIKDLSVVEILVDPKSIEVTSSFDTLPIKNLVQKLFHKTTENQLDEETAEIFVRKAIKYMREWMNYIKINAEWFWSVWEEVAPPNFPGSIAAPKQLKILLDGKELDENDMELKYQINPFRASQIIEGSGLYKSPLVFLREIIQNAVDALKIRIYRSNKDKIDLSHLGGQVMTFLDFIDEFHNDLKENIIDVNISLEEDESSLCIKITDRGVGIHRNQLERMSHIGSTKDPTIERDILRMPVWLRPSGNFGIGMQSVFLVADRFVFRTHPWESDISGDDMQYRMVFNSTRLGGDITSYDTKVNPLGRENWQDGNEGKYPCGSQFEVRIDLIKPSTLISSYSLFPQEIRSIYRRDLAWNLIKDARKEIKDTFSPDIFPICVSIGNSELKNFAIETITLRESIYDIDFKNLRFNKKGEELTIMYWYDDIDESDPFCVLYTFTTKSYKYHGETKLYFRGIRCAQDNRLLLKDLTFPDFNCSINIMSGDANDWLEVNRDNIKKEALSNIRNRLKKGIVRFIENMTEMACHIMRSPKNNEKKEKEIRNIIQTMLQQSKDVVALMMLQLISTDSSVKQEFYDIISASIPFTMDVASIDEQGKTISFVEKEISSISHLPPRFIDTNIFTKVDRINSFRNMDDIDKTESNSNYILFEEDEARQYFINKFPLLKDGKYSSVFTFVWGDGFEKKIMIAYETDKNASYTKIDKKSYRTIVWNLIEKYKKENYIGFPVFPAPDPSWFQKKSCDAISFHVHPSISSDILDNRYIGYTFAPFSISQIESSLKEISLGKQGITAIRECEIEKTMKTGYSQVFAYFKEYAGKDNSGKKISEKDIWEVWGEYAKVLSEILFGQ